MSAALDAKLQQAAAMHSQGAVQQAAALYAEILRVMPLHADALHLLGVAETQLGRAQRGAELIERSLAVNAHQPVAIANRGNALLALKRPDEALADYERAIALQPGYALAHFGRANALCALQRPADALPSVERALQLAPNFVEALNTRGGALATLERHDEAIASYDRALALQPQHAKALLNRAAAHQALQHGERALQDYDAALTLAPVNAEAWAARGQVLAGLGRTEEALQSYERALKLDPDQPAALFGWGIAVSASKGFATALDAFRHLLAVAPEYPHARGACLHTQLQLCDWRDYAESVDAVTAGLEADRAVDFPFSFLAVCDSPALQLRCGRRYSAKYPAPPRKLWNGEHYRHERIRIAYVSGDFLEHPISFLLAGVFERHDRRSFETIGLSLREDPASATGRRVRAAFDQVHAVGTRPDADIARLIRELEVDVAVDLMGYTGDHRAPIFVHRPAPVQVSYLGLPGTTGSPALDYIIGDEYLIPPAQQADYSEQVVYLPDCFQATDDRRIVAPAPTRAEVGLPQDAFVWCSFHSNYKLNPPLFDIWARLLREVPGSVLWTVGSNPVVQGNLRAEAGNIFSVALGGEDAAFSGGGWRLPLPRCVTRAWIRSRSQRATSASTSVTRGEARWPGI